MDLIFDTHALVWFAAGSPAFGKLAKEQTDRRDSRVSVSAVTAWEYADLRTRGRLAQAPAIDTLQVEMGFELLDFPAALWVAAQSLPDIHRDPVDRMLVAHAIAEDMTIVTADRRIRSYPVRTLW